MKEKNKIMANINITNIFSLWYFYCILYVH